MEVAGTQKQQPQRTPLKAIASEQDVPTSWTDDACYSSPFFALSSIFQRPPQQPTPQPIPPASISKAHISYPNTPIMSSRPLATLKAMIVTGVMLLPTVVPHAVQDLADLKTVIDSTAATIDAAPSNSSWGFFSPASPAGSLVVLTHMTQEGQY